MTALAIRDDQDFWTPEQKAVLAQTGIGDDVSNAELASFLHLCQRTGLDPFARQTYLIGRWDSQAGRKVFRPQTGIDGYRLVAQRKIEQTKESLSYDDTLWCGPYGQWVDVWLAKEPPAAAKVVVHRNGNRFSAVATWDEYVPLNRDGKPSGLWSKMPAVMIAKCAEALALRKAFPQDLAGVYTAEEMEQADSRPPANLRHVADPPTADTDGPEPTDDQLMTPAQDIANEAAKVRTVEKLKELFDAGKAADLLRVQVADPKTGEAYALTAFIARRKADLVAAEAEKKGRPAKPEDPAEEGGPDVEADPSKDVPLGDALAEFYAAGQAAGLSKSKADRRFWSETGKAVADATAAELLAFARLGEPEPGGAA